MQANVLYLNDISLDMEMFIKTDIRSALKNGISVLKTVNNKSAAVDSRILLCFVLKCEKTFLFSHCDYILTQGEYTEFNRLVMLRSKGVPIQHLIGCQEFMSLDFEVNPNVLIPRQETEILVEKLIEYIKMRYSHKDLVNILEIGTGSGCIAISIAFYIVNCLIRAVDISESALKIAKKNAILNKVDKKIDFRISDLFENVGDNKFDIIVSNPPYIEEKEIILLETQVKDYDPILALDGGIDGLDFYRLIVEKAPKYLKNKGYLAFEIGYNQGNEVCNLMKNYFSNIEITKDLDKNDRVISGILKS